MLDHTVQLDRNVLHFGQVHVKLRVVGTIVANAAADPAAKLAGRLLEHHRERTAFSVAAKQRALRPFQHFDPLNIMERRVEAVLAAKINAIQVDAYALFARRLVGIVRHDPANPDGQRGLARFEGRDAQRRNRAISQIHQALHAALFNIVLT